MGNKFYHGGVDSDFSIEEIDIYRISTKQNHKNRTNAGFYMFDELKRDKAFHYADQTNKTLNVQDRGVIELILDDNLKIYTIEGIGKIDRISVDMLKEYSDLGYDLLTGKSYDGQQYVLLNKNKIKSIQFETMEMRYKGENMEEKNININEYAKNILSIVRKKQDYDNNEVKKISNNMNLRVKDIIRENKIKNSTLERRIDGLSQNLHEGLKYALNTDTSLIVSNINDVFKNMDRESIGKNLKQEECKNQVNTILCDYAKAVNIQVQKFLEAYNVPDVKINQILIDVSNRVNSLKNKSINELQDYQKNMNDTLLSYITSQYEEYEKENINDKKDENCEKDNISSLKESVYTPEELAENALNDKSTKVIEPEQAEKLNDNKEEI